ncbi:NUDIX hydrolase [Solwaraspora sp. WMMA2056]|uniref:NUDIX hydrolase n=1 Tax=Solwaraspora sp. WMMA2056 TaxID=3015161 RepID=UPI00259BA3EB|nr:NUDIX hydrolase [Solwaraspora sp. WMMA2056]WJK44219.1 NUDIX hydrolase [Solwaraspora sp. WMMA2056]
MVEQASGFYAAGRTPAPTRLAATVLLLRPAADPGGDGVEVYLIRRVPAVAFGGVYAFPGGGVDPADADEDLDWVGPDPQTWAHRWGSTPEQARAVVCAAAREVFEETGVLFAGSDSATMVDAVDSPMWEEERQALLARTVSFAQLLRRHRLALRSDLLAPWSRWVTPAFERRRFDAHFFVARLPAGQATREVSGEADHGLWVTPRQALDRAAAGRWQLLPPTWVNLAEVGAYADPAAVFAASADRDAARPITPDLHVDPDGTVSFVVAAS